MPKFKIGDLMYHPRVPDFYYRVVDITDSTYYVDQYLSSDDSIRHTNQSGSTTQVDEDFIYYKPQSQIRRP